MIIRGRWAHAVSATRNNANEPTNTLDLRMRLVMVAIS
jgi:hypothetical protein